MGDFFEESEIEPKQGGINLSVSVDVRGANTVVADQWQSCRYHLAINW